MTPNKILLQQISDMIPTIPGEEWDFEHIMCDSAGCALGKAVERGILPRDKCIKPTWDNSDTTFGLRYFETRELLGLTHFELDQLFVSWPKDKKPTREFVRNRLQHFIDTGEISNDVPD